jgi:4a-hydroxytetrahydrobiopterin dehydratase
VAAGGPPLKGVTMTTLAEKKCTPCRGGVEPLKGDALQERAKELGPGWEVKDQKRLVKEFSFGDFREALDFVNEVGELAEEENHHPDIYFTYGKARISLSTHKIDGLHDNDFILAAKIDEL